LQSFVEKGEESGEWQHRKWEIRLAEKRPIKRLLIHKVLTNEGVLTNKLYKH
jgi:hypothetical protein